MNRPRLLAHALVPPGAHLPRPLRLLADRQARLSHGEGAIPWPIATTSKGYAGIPGRPTTARRAGNTRCWCTPCSFCRRIAARTTGTRNVLDPPVRWTSPSRTPVGAGGFPQAPSRARFPPIVASLSRLAHQERAPTTTTCPSTATTTMARGGITWTIGTLPVPDST
jgi:hypothetical protein